MRNWRLVSGLLLACSVVDAAGILVTRGTDGYEFAEAVAVLVGGKDKALSLGNQPVANGPLNKLPSVKIEGVILRDAASSALLLHEAAGPEYLLPSGLAKTTAPDVAAIWSTAAITYKKAEKDNAPSSVKPESFVAFLPSGTEGVVKLCTDPGSLAIVAGKDKAFAAQIELIRAATKQFGTTPAGPVLQKYVEHSMRDRYDGFEQGLLTVSSIDEGLVFAQLSREIYSGDAEQSRLRDALMERRSWLNRKMAILKAFYVAREWDAFLLGYAEFERYQQSFPDLVAKRREALQGSLELHRAVGKQRIAEGDHRSAVRELKLALKRMPSDSVLSNDYLVAWTEYSNQVAVAGQNNRKQLSSGQTAALSNALYVAEQYRSQKKLDDAMKAIHDAEQVDPNSLPMLLKKAEVLTARNELGKALATLDTYDLNAVDDQRAGGSKLRREIEFRLKESLKDVKAEVARAWNERRFYRALKLSQDGLGIKEDDADLLYMAGLASLATRQRKDGLAYLAKYLELSHTLEADLTRRGKTMQLVSQMKFQPEPAGEEKGEPNWMSAKALPKGVFYCPISLAFQPKVQRISASKKLRVDYVWEGNKLRSIVPVFEKVEEATGEKPVVFGYDSKLGQVMTAAYGDRGSAEPRDPDDAVRNSSVLFSNNPLVDPSAVQRLTGDSVTIGVAGNPYFHPFIWQKLHFFQLRYDASGRVKSAKLVTGADNSVGAPSELDFEWNGIKLMAIRGYQSSEPGRRVAVYERRMIYQDDKLMAEEIQSRGKTTKIQYKWKGDQLLMADCDQDETVDNRERSVAFVGAPVR